MGPFESILNFIRTDCNRIYGNYILFFKLSFTPFRKRKFLAYPSVKMSWGEKFVGYPLDVATGN